MPTEVQLTLTGAGVAGLFCIQRYRFLTIDQFARVTGLHRRTALLKLRSLEHQGFLGHFGNRGVRGYGKTPKAYYLTRKGWELLVEESAIPETLLGSFKEVKVEAAWSPQMYHRLRTVDLLVSLEAAVGRRPHLAIIQTFLEYRQIRRNGKIIRETTDYVDGAESAETKIIPDAAFILHNVHTGRRALFFVETDMGSERIITASIGSKQTTLHRKFFQYDRYLQSFRYQQTYKAYGEFGSFTMLFVTPQDTRIEHIRRELSDLPADLGAFYRFTTFGQALGDFLGAIWQSRLVTDRTRYPLVRE
jgi:Replication-relaxation